MADTYSSGDIVLTQDGRKHRVLFPLKNDRLHVKCAEGKAGKAYQIKTKSIVEHQRKVKS